MVWASAVCLRQQENLEQPESEIPSIGVEISCERLVNVAKQLHGSTVHLKAWDAVDWCYNLLHNTCKQACKHARIDRTF